MAASNGALVRAWGMLRWLMGLGLLAFLAMCYMDVVFLPQQKTQQDAEATIAAFGRELTSLRNGAKNVERERKIQHETMQLRVEFLETLVRGLDPELGLRIDARLEAMQTTTTPAPQGTPALMPAAAKEDSADAETDEPKKGKPTKEPRLRNEKKKPKFEWRKDDKCGKEVPGAEGTLVGCNPEGTFPCCSQAGWCGSTYEHCTCTGCTDFRHYDGSADTKAGPVSDASYNEEFTKSIALVVPFRDRASHLEKFREKIEALVEEWNNKNVRHTWMVFIVEQFDNELFNRGWLFNVGFQYATKYAQAKGTTFDCIVMHDVDILPTPVVDYGWCLQPNQLSGEIDCWGNSVPYQDSTGGVISLSPAHWSKINGFSNEYQGWGGEDDDLYQRLRINDLLHGSCHTFCKPPSRVPMVHRPALGKGRFTCLNDGDHTPRQRNQNDQAMWSRLSAMKANSKRWREDGISSIALHHAGEPLESPACETECEAPEDPTPRKRLFGEHWSRVSMKTIPGVQRIRVMLPATHKCAGETPSLLTVPVGVAHLRRMLPVLFGKCEVTEEWALKQNFVLVDTKLGQSVLVGSDAPVVVADLALPLLRGKATAAASKGRDPEYVVQGQRLSRWLRRLPVHHSGWIAIATQPLPEIQAQSVKKGRRYPMTVPACIATAKFGQSSKYRVTPGTTWCGDGGWTSGDHFMVLRSNTSVPEDKLVPICIGYSSTHHLYRYENSVDGCVGRHGQSQTDWVHVGTMHSSSEATGDNICVGQADEGPRTRWMMRKSQSCDVEGYHHKFSFKAMNVKVNPVFAASCLFTAASQDGKHSLMRLAASDKHGCQKRPAEESGFEAWKNLREMSLLTKRHSKSDHRLCAAHASVDLALSGASDAELNQQPIRGWRLLKDKHCDHAQHNVVEKTLEGDISVTWSVHEKPKIYFPESAAGVKICVCRTSDTATAKERLQYTLTERECVAPRSVEDFCFNSLSGEDLVQASYLLDEPA